MRKFAYMLFMIVTLNISAQENKVDYKKGAIDILTESFKVLEKEVANLSKEELNYKPEGKWSILNHLEHLSVVEELLTGRMTKMIQENKFDNSKDLSANDWLVISQVSDRANKVVTPPPFRPQPDKAKMTKDDFLVTIKKNRLALIELVKSTDVNLRKIFGPYPYGEVDGIQSCMVIGAHNNRHTVHIRKTLEEQRKVAQNN